MKLLTPFLKILCFSNFLFLVTACGTSQTGNSLNFANEDASTSGTVASTVGGAANGSSGGTMASTQDIHPTQGTLASTLNFLLPLQIANASVACPTVQTGGSNCTANTTLLKLTYAICSFGSSNAVWNGSQNLVFGGSAVLTCGSAFPSGITSIARTFGSGTDRVSASGVDVKVDSSGSYTAVDGNIYSGGTTTTFSSGKKTGLSITGLNLWATGFHHTLTTNAGAGGSPLVFTNGSTITSGTVVTFHNLAKVKAASTFSSVGFTSGCCTPTSGTITTTFSAITGVTPTTLGAKLAGTNETLTFTGCGTATYAGNDGTPGPVTLSHCF